jgi:hypothetical protein
MATIGAQEKGRPVEVGIALDMHMVGDYAHRAAMNSLFDIVALDRILKVRNEVLHFGESFINALKACYKDRMPDHIWVYGLCGKDIVRVAREIHSAGIHAIVLEQYCDTGEDEGYLERSLPFPVYHGKIESRQDLFRAVREIKCQIRQEES